MSVPLLGIIPDREEIGIGPEHGVLEVIRQAQLPPYAEHGTEGDGAGEGHGEQTEEAVNGGRGEGGGGGGFGSAYGEGGGGEAEEGVRGGRGEGEDVGVGPDEVVGPAVETEALG